ncbi:MAG: histidine kinase [Cytophagales bacterium]|nr:histidine kinase [Cytophagales bacterium]
MLPRQQTRTLKHIEISIFVVIWLLVLLSPIMVRNEWELIMWRELKGHWIRMAPFMLLTLINHFVLVPYLLFRKKNLMYAIGIVAVVLVIFIAFTWIFTTSARPEARLLLPPRGINPTVGKMEHRPAPLHALPPIPRERDKASLPPKINFLVVAILIVGFDTGLRTVFRWNKTDRERLKLEKENINNQLALLRNQVNPHFFMNTLNNIHALIDLNTIEAKEAIIRLSHLMRHLLYDSNVELSPVSKELKFIESYIDLMKLRYSEKVEISLQLPEYLPDKKIPPLLFTSLLENAFKHGISYSKVSFVRVIVIVSEEELTFRVRNSKMENKYGAGPSGIGIENTKRRLDLIYREKYQLVFSESENEFNVRLIIPL